MSSYPNYISIIKFIFGARRARSLFCERARLRHPSVHCRRGGVPHRHPDRSCGHEHRQSLLGIA